MPIRYNPITITYPLPGILPVYVAKYLSTTVGDLTFADRKTEIKIVTFDGEWETYIYDDQWIDLPDMVEEVNKEIIAINDLAVMQNAQPELLHDHNSFICLLWDRWLFETTGKWIDDYLTVEISVFTEELENVHV